MVGQRQGRGAEVGHVDHFVAALEDERGGLARKPRHRAVAQRALKLCDSAQSVIALVEGPRIRFVAGYGSTASAVGETVELSRGLVIGRAVIDRRSVHIRDLALESESEYPGGLQMQRRIGHHTTLAEIGRAHV